MSVGIIDYGAGNIGSVRRALGSLGVESRVCRKPDDLDGLSALVFPGVGHFGQVIHRLASTGLDEAIVRFIEAGRSFLGICVGMQVLFSRSEEAEDISGLGLFKGEVLKLHAEKIPQIGWNHLVPMKVGLPEGYAYFVNSYVCVPEDESITAYVSRYGSEFCAGVFRGNVAAFQFHPEKSGAFGISLLRSWLSGEFKGEDDIQRDSGEPKGLAKRIIPCLDVMDGRVVKGVRFTELTDEGDPVELAARYDREGADELVFLDIGATPHGKETMVEVAEKVAQRLFIPFTVGGGVRSVDDARALLEAGAEKISVNSAAVRRPEFIGELSGRFGSQSCVLAIDARRVGNGSWEVLIDGGRTPTGLDALEWAVRGVELGAGEILLTSWDRDGSGLGFDVELTRSVADAVSVPVIASGGGWEPQHFVEVFSRGKADAGLAASIFHRKIWNLNELKSELAKQGIPMRLTTGRA